MTIRNGDATKTFTAKPTGKPGVYRASVVVPERRASGRYEVNDGFITGQPHTFPAVEIGAPGAPRPAADEADDRDDDGAASLTWLAIPGIALLLAAVASCCCATGAGARPASAAGGVRATTLAAGGLACAGAAMTIAAFAGGGSDDPSPAPRRPRGAAARTAGRPAGVDRQQGCGVLPHVQARELDAPIGPDLALIAARQGRATT